MPLLLTFFFFNDTATTQIYTLSLHDALPIFRVRSLFTGARSMIGHEQARLHLIGDLGQLLRRGMVPMTKRSEEHTSELQSRRDLVCRLLLEKKKKKVIKLYKRTVNIPRSNSQ